jgi:hypothetical protein
MSYALVVGTATMENRITALLVLAVHRDLAFEDAMRLLGERPAGTVGHLRRLPADLPEIGEILQLDARGQARFNASPSHRGRPRTHTGGQP